MKHGAGTELKRVSCDYHPSPFASSLPSFLPPKLRLIFPRTDNNPSDSAATTSERKDQVERRAGLDLEFGSGLVVGPVRAGGREKEMKRGEQGGQLPPVETMYLTAPQRETGRR
jgi:hypothetical protein